MLFPGTYYPNECKKLSKVPDISSSGAIPTMITYSTYFKKILTFWIEVKYLNKVALVLPVYHRISRAVRSKRFSI